MYLKFNVINLYYVLTNSLQTSTTLLVVFVSLSQSGGKHKIGLPGRIKAEINFYLNTKLFFVVPRKFAHAILSYAK
jgi:hypothetical protein